METVGVFDGDDDYIVNVDKINHIIVNGVQLTHQEANTILKEL